MKTNDSKTVQKLVAMLREAHKAVAVELAASGPDDVKDHPVLSGKAKMLDRHEAALKKMGF
jgi:hypothetical protein